jgi:hypothetical protein
MTKIQIVEHDISEGFLPKAFRETIAEWLNQHGLKYASTFRIEDSRIVGDRYLLNGDGRRYIWHADRSEHTGRDCAQCKDGSDGPYEAAWESYDVQLQTPPPTFEVGQLPGARR